MTNIKAKQGWETEGVAVDGNSPVGRAIQPIYYVEDLTLFQRYKINIYTRFVYVENWSPGLNNPVVETLPSKQQFTMYFTHHNALTNCVETTLI